MKLIAILSFFLSCLVSNAQAVGNTFNPQDLSSYQIYNSLSTPYGSVNFEKIDGSPFLDEDFKKGKVIEKEKNQTIITNLRYNIYLDKFEIRPNLNEEKLIVLKRSSNYEFIYNGNRVNLVLNNQLFEENGNGYVFTISESDNGGYNLYKTYSQDFTPPEKARTSYGSDKKARLDTNINYYISKDISKGFTKLDINRRKILDAFESNFESKIKDFMKSNDYKLRGDNSEIEVELADIVTHYNSLVNN